MWTPIVFLALGSLIVALGAFVIAGISLFMTLKDRGERGRVQFEQKKQQVIGVLVQAKLMAQDQVIILNGERVKAAISINQALIQKIDDGLAYSQELVQRIDSVVNQAESLDQDRLSSNALVDIETVLGQAQTLKLNAESPKALHERTPR